MPLAPQVANPGSRGQDSRFKFDPTWMTDLGGGRYTDGTYTYAGDDPNSLLSLDRPSVAVGGLPPADDTHAVARYSASLRPGAGLPARPAAPISQIQMGMMIPGGSTPGDPQFRATGNWADPIKGAAAQQAFREFLMSQMGDILRKSPGLYKDEADYTGDVDALMAGNVQPILDRNAKQLRYIPPPREKGYEVPPPLTPNPYGTLGPSPGRVAAVQRQNPYGGLGVSPQRVANVNKAGQSMAPGMVRPLGSKPLPAPKQAPLPGQPVPKLQAPPKGTPIPKIAPPPKKPKPPPRRGGV